MAPAHSRAGAAVEERKIIPMVAIGEVVELRFVPPATISSSTDRMRRSLSLLLASLLACAPRGTSAPGTTPSNLTNASARTADSLALLRLQQRGREAHLAKRADWLVAGQADTLLSVSRGGVSITPRERVQANFQPYLDASTFQAWDDIVPPRIRISPDGQMAYVVVQKRVHLTARDSTGATQAERTRFAWMSVYEKQGGEWRMTAIASTDRPDTP